MTTKKRMKFKGDVQSFGSSIEEDEDTMVIERGGSLQEHTVSLRVSVLVPSSPQYWYGAWNQSETCFRHVNICIATPH